MIDEELSDKDVLERSLEKPHYFEVLVTRYQEAFLRKSTRVVHSQEEAEDVVQETFLKIYKYGHKFKEQPGASFKSWAYKILLNTCYTYYMKQKRNASRVELVDFGEFEVEDVNAIVIPEETDTTHSYIEKILGKMPESFAKVLKLYFLEEKTQKEIAKIENISPEAVRTRVHRAKKYFKSLSIHTI